MNYLVSASGLIVLLVLVLGGLAKLGKTKATISTIESFGFPHIIARTFAPVLPYIEIIIGASLLLPFISLIGAWASFVLLAIFAVIVSRVVVKGQQVACNCFGQSDATAVSWVTATRNIVLASLALVLAVNSTLFFENGMGSFWFSLLSELSWYQFGALLLLLILLLQGWLILNLLQQQGRIILRVDNLENQYSMITAPVTGQDLYNHNMQEIGSAMPRIDAISVWDEISLDWDLISINKRSFLLIFVSPDCSPCHEVLSEVCKQMAPNHILVMSSGSPKLNQKKFSKFSRIDLVCQTGLEANNAYGVIGTPSAVHIANGRIASTIAIGRDAILELSAQIDQNKNEDYKGTLQYIAD